MTRVLAALVVGTLLGSAGVAGAVVHSSATKARPLLAGQAVSFSGLTCTAYNGTTPTNANIVCVRNNLKGLGVIVSQDLVVIAKQQGTGIKVVFRKANK